MPQVKYEKLVQEQDALIPKIRERVKTARQIQGQRFSRENIMTNAEMQIPQIKKYCEVPLQSQNILRQYVNSAKLSARGYHRVLKVARTIADLDNSEKILNEHLQEALMYRIKDND